MNKKRFKNYGLWAAIAAFIPMFLKSFGIDVLPSNYSEVVQAFLSILVLAGIISNPDTEYKGFMDDGFWDSRNKEKDAQEPKKWYVKIKWESWKKYFSTLLYKNYSFCKLSKNSFK